MISEVERIQKGLVEATVEFDTQRKVIGVATTNLLPNENGIVPLSKQGAFQTVEQTVETVDFTEAINEAQKPNSEEIIEQLDLPVLGDTIESQTAIQEPVHSDVLTDNPVNVESPQDLSGFKIPEPVMEEEPAVMEPIGPVAADIQMPQMPETIVASEPEMTNDNIFESISTQSVEPTVPTVEPTITDSETILNSIPTADVTSEEPPVFEPIEEPTITQEQNTETSSVGTNPELEITEPIIEQLNQVQEPLKQEIEEDINIPEILDIDKIIENNRQTLLAYADELIKAAEQIKEFVNKSFDEINTSVKSLPKETQKNEGTQPQQLITNQVDSMVATGNNLVDDAISRINAIAQSGPTL